MQSGSQAYERGCQPAVTFSLVHRSTRATCSGDAASAAGSRPTPSGMGFSVVFSSLWPSHSEASALSSAVSSMDVLWKLYKCGELVRGSLLDLGATSTLRSSSALIVEVCISLVTGAAALLRTGLRLASARLVLALVRLLLEPWVCRSLRFDIEFREALPRACNACALGHLIFFNDPRRDRKKMSMAIAVVATSVGGGLQGRLSVWTLPSNLKCSCVPCSCEVSFSSRIDDNMQRGLRP